MEDLYGTLGVQKSASLQEIRAAFRRLAAETHPDLHPHMEGRFKEISRAYAVLADPGLREKYDRSCRAGGARVGTPASPVFTGGRSGEREWWASREIWESAACPDCDGTGQLRGAVREACLFCRGWGAVVVQGAYGAEWRTCQLC